MNEQSAREQLVAMGALLYRRGYAFGGAGNLSVKVSERRFLMTPTNSCLGELASDELSLMDLNGELLDGPAPTKEFPLHLAFYRGNNHQCGGIVHLHCHYLTTLSCIRASDPTNILPPVTPYYVMKVGSLPLIPYRRPGDPDLAELVAEYAKDHRAVLLANHGPVVTGRSLRRAVFNAEELEATARVYLELLPHNYRLLEDEQVAELLHPSADR